MNRSRVVGRRTFRTKDRRYFQPRIEELEDRRLLSIFVVNSPGDEPDKLPGDGQALTIKGETTLRAAIMEANATAGKDTIEFKIPGADHHVIRLASSLPPVQEPVTIDGYSQPGAKANSLALSEGNNAVIKIEIDGSKLPIGIDGLHIEGGNSEVMGLAIHSFFGRPIKEEEFLGTMIRAEGGIGIMIWGGGNNVIAGNFLGATAEGIPVLGPDTWGNSEGIDVGSSGNVVQGNVIVQSEFCAVGLGAKLRGVVAPNVQGNKLFGNYIGVGPDGRTPMPNTAGVLICWGALSNEIGGDQANLGNVISGNEGVGVSIVGIPSEGPNVGSNVIRNNLIGPDRTGATIDPDGKPGTGDDLGNEHSGVQIDRSVSNQIGPGNVISGNEAGVLIAGMPSRDNRVFENTIGADISGTKKLPNRLSGVDIQDSPANLVESNLISGNRGAGVRMGDEHTKGNTIRNNKIGLDASGAKKLANEGNGVDIVEAAENSIESNTISGNQGTGVYLDGAEAKDNWISQNLIGADPTGELPLGNAEAGVSIVGGSGNTIDGNVIADNKIGGIVIMEATAKNNHVHGNRIGTNRAGTNFLGNDFNGIHIQDAPENDIGSLDPASRNLISGNKGDGVHICGKQAKGNVVSGNYIGTDLDGAKGLANGGAGVWIDGAPENTVGGNQSTARNVISANLKGGVIIVGVDALKNKVQGNYIGTDKNGAGGELGNFGDGVLIDGASETLVGGTASTIGDAPGNLISGNWGSGVQVKGTLALDNKIQGNLIGRDKADAALGNAAHGIHIENTRQTTIGEPSSTSAPAASTGNSNIISGNKGDGVRVQGDQNAVGNLIRRNEIYDNAKLGINLVGGKEWMRTKKDGVTPNDHLDGDKGANDLLNFPVGVTSFYGPLANQTYISGVLSTTNPELMTVDLYANTAVDPSGFGEGRYYLGSVTPNKDGAFHLTLAGPLDKPLLPGKAIFLSATTVDAGLSTSEFSPCYGDPDGDGKVDSDGDALPDDWERKGLDFNGDDVIDLDLPKLGAKWNRKDVFVETDYMDGQQPAQDALDAVTTAFRRANVPNPDGSLGIALHADPISKGHRISPAVKPVNFEKDPADANDFWDLKQRYFGTQADRDASNKHDILGARSLVYHYNIVVEEVTGDAGGWGEELGDDFVNNKHTNWQGDAAAFMHELGHNLGLNHSGPISADAAVYNQGLFDYMPNHLSVMNYFYTHTWWTPRRPLDYSRYAQSDLAVLDEAALFEGKGITGAGTPWGLDRWTVAFTYPLGGTARIANAPSDGPINWNVNGVIDTSPIQANINDPPTKPVTANNKDVMRTSEEWNHLRYDFRSARNLGGTVHAPGFEGIAAIPEEESFIQVARTLDSDGDGINNADDNVPFVFNPDQADSDGDGIGDLGELAGLSLSAASVPSGTSVTGTVTLLLPAPAQGAWIDLFSSEPWIVDLPERVFVPAGARGATFTFPVNLAGAEPTEVVIHSSYGIDLLSTELFVGPPLPNADLAVAMSAAPEPVGPGGDLAYTITVTNHGPTAATGVVLSDVLPGAAQLVSFTGTQTFPPPENTPISIRFDYSYDGYYDPVSDTYFPPFFNTQEKRDLLEMAAQLLAGEIRDDLDAIIPSGSNHWAATFTNPSTGQLAQWSDPRVEANELVVFVGGRDLGSGGTSLLEGGEGGRGGSTAQGTPEFVNTVQARGERNTQDTAWSNATDFGPWGGSVSFNTNAAVKYHFGETTAGLDPDELDFVSVAMHELAHVLGLGTAPSWDTSVDHATDVFNGPASRAEYDPGGTVPLDPAWGHWLMGTTDGGEPALMDPVIGGGTRELPTRLDLAGLKDVGWDDQNAMIVVPLPYTHSAGNVRVNVGGLDPGESVTVKIVVTPTAVPAATNTVSVTGDGTDPDPTNNTAQLANTVLPCPPLVVNSTWDGDDRISDGRVTTLREAIRLANLLPGTDTIRFNIPGTASIYVGSALPTITDPVVIDGTTQPGYAGTPVVFLTGSYADRGFNGLHITAGNSTVRGLAICGFYLTPEGSITSGDGILLEGGGGNVIEGNYLGSAWGWNEGSGIALVNSDGNRLGGTTPEARNVISGNYNWGILLYQANNNVIQGNYIGTDPTGQAAAGNGAGITLAVADYNQIGGTEFGADNVISGNRGIGIEVSLNALFTNASHNRIEGNLIGVAADGTSPLGNGSHGVVSWLGNTDNIVGGRDPAARNTIAFNGGAGVLYGASNSNSQIVGNSIYSNAGLGIDRLPIGVDQNSAYYWLYPSPDYPTLTYALSDTSSTRIRGTIKGLANTSFELDFYSSETADPSGYGEGQEWVGTATVTTDALGLAPFYLSFPSSAPAGQFIAATATQSMTSEFSNSVVVRADRDHDGVADAEEDAGPNSGDADRDGTLDSFQPHVATLRNTGDQRYLTLKSPADTPLYGVWAIENPSPSNSPYAVPFPLGFLDGVIEGVPAGGSTTVTLLVPAGVVPHAFYQFGPTAGSTHDFWYEFPFDGTTGAEVFADRVVLHYVDGGRGDHDREANGRIAFLGGVGGPPAMHVVDTTPAQNDSQAPLDTQVSVTFGENINPATVSDQTFVVHAAQSGTLPVQPNVLTVDRATATLTPAGPFLPGELVEVTATSGIQSTGGESPPSGFVWQFRTAVEGGTGVFAESDQTFSYPETRAVALGDLDGDGDLDAFFTNYPDVPNTVWLNDGQSHFTDTGQRFGTWGFDVALGDLDGDGDLDAVVASYFPHIWLNGGQAHFSDGGQLVGSLAMGGVTLGDLDGDGDLDILALAGKGSAGDCVWLNDGQAHFTSVPTSIGSSNVDAALGDLDGDGDLDAFVVKSLTTDEANAVWLNDGQGNFTDSNQRLGSYDSRAVALADFDSDGDLDALVASFDQDNRVWLNNGQGHFTDSGQSLGHGAVSVALGDFDGDVDLDVLLTTQVGGEGGLWLNDGQGHFQPEQHGPTHLELPTTGAGLAAGDLDGDGDLDGIAANCNAFGRGYEGAALLINCGNGAFEEDPNQQRFEIGGDHPFSYAWDAQLADLDGDGDLDAVMAGDPIQLWLNDGRGHFSDSGQRLGRGDVTVGDVDADGDLDLLVHDTGDYTYAVRLWRNDGHGSFSYAGEACRIPYASRLALGDLDGDGDQDIAVVREQQQPNQVWLNDGQGHFSDSGQRLGGSPYYAFDLALSDLDNDGDLDIFLVSNADIPGGTINTVWLNDGHGRFTDSGQRLGFPKEVCWGAKLADFDGDGDVDAFTSIVGYVWSWVNWGWGWVEDFRGHQVWLNDGQGHFADTGQRLEPGWVNPYERPYPAIPAGVGDIDADGDLDVLVADSAYCQRWLNDGRGSFSDGGRILASGWVSGYSLDRLAMGDVDADGDLDALAAQSLWLNQNPDQINHPPAAADDGYTVDQDTSLDVSPAGVLANDSEPDGQTLVAAIVEQPLHAASFELREDGSFTYTPQPGYSGPDSFTYQAIDPEGLRVEAVASVFVVPGAAALRAGDDQATTSQAVSVAIDVLANDRDRSGPLDPTTIALLSQPAHGLATADLDSGMVTYTPRPEFVGTDQFTYRIGGATGLSDTALVTVEVLPGNQPPLAENDTVQTKEDTPIVIAVLTNDADPEGALDPTTVLLWLPPGHGFVDIDSATGAAAYTPQYSFFGVDNFVYQVSDAQGASDTATVTITVLPVNDPPQADDDQAEALQGAAVVIDVLVNDADPDNNLDPGSVVVIEGPANGSVIIDPATGAMTYTPTVGFVGVDTLIYRVSDTASASDTATVTVQVLSANHAPQAADDAAATDEKTAVTIDVVANDADEDGNLDPRTVRILVGPGVGSVAVDPATGRMTYTPEEGGDGEQRILYEVRDTSGATDVAMVTVTVRSINDPPQANDDAVVVDQGMSDKLLVLLNDSDVDGAIDPSTVTVVSGPDHGSARVNDDGSVLYTPAADFVGVDSFTYTVRDNDGAVSNTATVVITVRPEPTTSIAGRKFEDSDRDGPGLEGPGLGGFTICLFDGLGQPVATTQTLSDDPQTLEDESGQYRFEGLSPGTYVVAETLTPDWVQSHPQDQGIRMGEGDVAAGVHVVTVGAGTPAIGLDFGNYRVTALQVTVALNDDTAPSGPDALVAPYRTDGLTNDPTVSGFVAHSQQVTRLEARVDDGPLVDITASLTGDQFMYTPAGLAPGQHAVTIRVTDNDGLTAESAVSFQLNTPPVACSGGDRSIGEGQTLLMDGLPSSDAEAAIFAYLWSFHDGTRVDAPTAWRSYTQDGTYPVSLTVTDTAGSVVTDTAMIAVQNLSASIDPIADRRSDEEQSLALVAQFVDPGVLDTHTARVDWGDGFIEDAMVVEQNGAGTASSTHAYHRAGTYQGYVTIIDDGGAEARAAFTVTVASSMFGSILVLNPKAAGALVLSGYAKIAIPGNVTVDSNSCVALAASGSAKITASTISVVGAFNASGYATLSPTPTVKSPYVPDPLAALPAPTAGPWRGEVRLANGSLTINPGVYSSIRVSDGALTLNPGIYVIKGGGLTVNGQSTVSGAGVLIYNAGSEFPRGGGSFAGINVNGQAVIDLTPASSGPYAGIVIFQARDNTRNMAFSGYSNLTRLNGLIYAPAAYLGLSGYAKLSTPLIVNRLEFSGCTSDSMASGAESGGAANSPPPTTPAPQIGTKLLVANPNGPYVLDQGADLELDASGSFDPEAAFGDSIVAFEWDLDNDGQFDDAFGEQPVIPWQTIRGLMAYPADPTSGLPANPIGLRVVDSFQESSVASTTVTIFDNRPVADLTATPTPSACNQTIAFDAGGSYHGRPDRSIVLYEWDFDGDGTYDLSGTSPTATHIYTLFGSYTPTLRVTDDNTPPKTDTASLTVDFSLGTVDFRRLDGLSLAGGSVYYVLETAHTGFLTLEVIAPEPPKSARIKLYNQDPLANPGLAALVTSTLVDGNQRADLLAGGGETYYVELYGSNPDFDLRIANLVYQSGTNLTVFGTADDDTFEFNASGPRSVAINGVKYPFADEDVATVGFDGGDGHDTVSMFDSPGDDMLEAWSSDTAVFSNTAADAVPDFTVTVHDYEEMHVYASSDGHDTARLYGTAGNDKFKSEPIQNYAKLYGGGQYNRVKFFDEVDVYAGSTAQLASPADAGNDLARLWDTDGDDTFRGGRGLSEFSGPGFDIRLHDYRQVCAYGANAGKDVATLVDSALKDELQAKPHKSEIFDMTTGGDVYKVTARGFSMVRGEASNTEGAAQNGGRDKAKLYGTLWDDLVGAAEDWLHYDFSKDGDLDRLYEILAFESVTVRTTEGGKDTKSVTDPLAFELLFEEGWGTA